MESFFSSLKTESPLCAMMRDKSLSSYRAFIVYYQKMVCLDVK